MTPLAVTINAHGVKVSITATAQRQKNNGHFTNDRYFLFHPERFSRNLLKTLQYREYEYCRNKTYCNEHAPNNIERQ